MAQQKKEHSDCGTGFIVDPHHPPSNTLVRDALTLLARYKHRGAVAVDGKTGDGAGILTQLPKDFFRRVLYVPDDNFGVGSFFLPKETEARKRAQAIIQEELNAVGLKLASGWRDVPLDETQIGDIALHEKPAIQQAAFAVDGDTPAEELEKRAYEARKAIEERFVLEAEKDARYENAYVTSLSSSTMVYKGLMQADQVGAYTDLLAEDYVSNFAMVHSRFSTNTVSTWKGAHPYPGGTAHNGEINTIEGNQQMFDSRINETGGANRFIPGLSDSGRLDAVWNHERWQNGRPMEEAMMMLMPPAWQHDEHLPDDVRAMFEYWALEQEPFDGPAHVISTDGRYILAHLDRGGFRPSRFMISENGRMTVGSEEGLYDLPDDDAVKEYGRLAAGQAILMDSQTGEIWKHEEILESLASRVDYKALLEERKREMTRTPLEEYEVEQDDWAALLDDAKTYGWHEEVLSLFIGPMLLKGKEAVTAMGDDTPVPCMSTLPWDLSYYFKQRFAQVTNPPVDSKREGTLMSLRVALGAKANVAHRFNHDTHQVVLESPLLRPGELQELMQGEHIGVSEPLAMTYDANGGKAAMEAAIEQLKQQAIAAAEQGHLVVLSDKHPEPGHAVIPASLAVAAVHEALRDEGARFESVAGRLTTSIVVETGQVTNPHQAALLLGMGASAIDMFALRDAAVHLQQHGKATMFTEDFSALSETTAKVAELSQDALLSNMYTAMDNGVKKIMSKMGINDVESYIGGKHFEAVGLDLDPEREPVLAHAFRNVSSQIAGHGLEHLAENQEDFAYAREASAGNGKLERFGKHTSLRAKPGYEIHGFSKQEVSRHLNMYAEELLNGQLYKILFPALKALVDANPEPSLEVFIQEVNRTMTANGVAVGWNRFSSLIKPIVDELNLEYNSRALKQAYEAKYRQAAEVIKGAIADGVEESWDVERMVETVDAILAGNNLTLNLGEIAEAIEKVSEGYFGEHQVLDVYEARQIEKEQERGPRSREDLNSHIISDAFYDLMARLNRYGAEHPTALRDMLAFRTLGAETDYTKVAENWDATMEAADILQTFKSGAMSDGALTRTGHAAIAVGMNNVGASSNTGEGGERTARWKSPLRNAKIKQVASGRFGVTAEYLANVPEDGEIEIKIAQGAKPGEGGQLPGGKVSVYIASNRSGIPGVELISPPPHHDIYSIEDLAQLIYDLKSTGRKVGVKLVSSEGIGTISVGVAKALIAAGLDEHDMAGMINVAGNSGGTGAAPVTSTYHAGLPSELGLAEVDQALREAGLRQLIDVRASGGIKTADDIIKMAILGADSFEFGTLPMNLIGCQMIKKCHIPGACAPGVANNLAGFEGEADVVSEYMTSLAQQVRERLAELGVTNLQSLRGRVDLLEQQPNLEGMRGNMDLSTLLQERVPIKELRTQEIYNLKALQVERIYDEFEKDINAALEAAAQGDLRKHVITSGPIPLANEDRSVGGKIAVEFARRVGSAHRQQQGSDRIVVPEDFIRMPFEGVAGQSFGLFNVHGMEMHLKGIAQDYVGKNMSGGIVALEACDAIKSESQDHVIAGNAALYGASGGRAFFNGQMGDRFAVRASGVTAVVEGVGAFACEYMTSGTVLNIGKMGKNFGVGMSGGIAYQFDPDGTQVRELDETQCSVYGISDAHKQVITSLLEEDVQHTHSQHASMLLAQMEREPEVFWEQFHMIVPKAMEQMIAPSQHEALAAETMHDAPLVDAASFENLQKVREARQTPLSPGMETWMFEMEEQIPAAER